MYDQEVLTAPWHCHPHGIQASINRTETHFSEQGKQETVIFVHHIVLGIYIQTHNLVQTQCALQSLCFAFFIFLFLQSPIHETKTNKQKCKQNRTWESSNIKSQLTCFVFFVDLSLHTLVNIYICWCIHLSVTIPTPVNTCTFQYIHLSVHTPVTISTPSNTHICQCIHLSVTILTPVNTYTSVHTNSQCPSIPFTTLKYNLHINTVLNCQYMMQTFTKKYPSPLHTHTRPKKNTKTDTIIGSYYSSLHQNFAMFVSSSAEKPNLSDKRWRFQQGSPSSAE